MLNRNCSRCQNISCNCVNWPLQWTNPPYYRSNTLKDVVMTSGLLFNYWNKVAEKYYRRHKTQNCLTSFAVHFINSRIKNSYLGLTNVIHIVLFMYNKNEWTHKLQKTKSLYLISIRTVLQFSVFEFEMRGVKAFNHSMGDYAIP